MCGICGFIGPACGVEDRGATLQAMKDRIIHRGPDDEGSFIDGVAALGFRRLSIIDLDHGHQPMTNEDGSVIVTLNGEIYNYLDIRAELIERGHRFATDADTEVLVHGWEEYGEGMLDHLRGMFAFVIWDADKHLAFGARDFFGIKPFYYTLQEGSETEDGESGAEGVSDTFEAAARIRTFVYASEIKSILAHPSVVPELNLEAFEQYLSFQYSALPETFFKGIFKLGPGECFTFAQGVLTTRRYFDPLPAVRTVDELRRTHSAPFEHMVEQVKAVMAESVHAHMIADVEVGSLLSSGIDSSYITALYPNERTYTVGF